MYETQLDRLIERVKVIAKRRDEEFTRPENLRKDINELARIMLQHLDDVRFQRQLDAMAREEAFLEGQGQDG